MKIQMGFNHVNQLTSNGSQGFPMVRLCAAWRFINECVPDVLVQFITVFILNSNTFFIVQLRTAISQLSVFYKYL